MELNEVFKRFGDEQYHTTLAKKIVEARIRKSITTTGDFKQAIRDAFPST